ncbi:B-cell scaffold protein with ankyrin repeats-like [Gouania willdenowi]|uniref:B-cell scaffold protein with ankyrin repeats-like n=1 Tax=Gouania willdenowi TaxID=441366 RepID=UPI00105636DB|nr:B-cell scaffold protein with ankyrin repeats [Gouania willdenowi]
MSHTGMDLLIIYEIESKSWVVYLQSVFAGHISNAGIRCFDITTVSSRRDDFLDMAQYKCKILILTSSMLRGLCQSRRFFLSRVLSPAAHVVVLLSGVDSLTPLLQLVPLSGDECFHISKAQDTSEYLSAVADIVSKGTSVSNVNPVIQKPLGSKQKVARRQPSEADGVTSTIVVIPGRVPRGSSTDVFILLKNELAGYDSVVEFTAVNQKVRVKPVRWNERILCVRAPDFPAGNVHVSVYSGGVLLNTAEMQYYSSMEEMACLLSQVADPVLFMCQALQVSSVDQLDQRLASMLLEKMSNRSIRRLKRENSSERDVHSLLHFMAQYGFRSASSVLLQCPGAQHALHTTNAHEHTPMEIAKSHGHTELHALLNETLNMFDSAKDGDDNASEMMCSADVQQKPPEEDGEEEEDFYAALRVNDEDYIPPSSLKSVMIVNRPPAPIPRPQSTQVTESKTPFIAQVFQKTRTTTQDCVDLYALPSKLARSRAAGLTSTCDTFVQTKLQRPKQLSEQQRVEAGWLNEDGAPERSGDQQEAWRGEDAKQQETLSHLQAGKVENREDSNGVYDIIKAVYHMPSTGATVNKSGGGSQPVESRFYSEPLKKMEKENSSYISF